jgi:hypothetical protein
MPLLAATAAPNAAANGVIDRIFDAIMKGTLPPNDLKILEHAAEGRFEESDVAVALSLGINRAAFSPLSFWQEGVRAHALMKIGETGLAEALRYLEGIRFEDVRNFQSQEPWHAARIALHVAKMNEIQDPAGKISFLRSSLTDRDTGIDDVVVQFWAMRELCSRGDGTSLPSIRRFLHKIYSGERGDEQIQSCEAKMELVTRSSDRVQALASALKIDVRPSDLNLIAWAVSQLDELHSQEAYRELSRFGAEIRALPPNSELAHQFSVIGENIRVALAQWVR